MKRFKVGKLRLEEGEFKTSLGSGNTIFIGSSIDIFANKIPEKWIERVLEYCKRFDNTYLFQSKNPVRFMFFNFPQKTILGTTLETNKDLPITKAPRPEGRKNAMLNVKRMLDFPTMISIEPVMDFDLNVFTTWIYQLRPKFVSVGADSKRHGLTEPSPEKLKLFINELEKITEVKTKSNLDRLFK